MSNLKSDTSTTPSTTDSIDALKQEISTLVSLTKEAHGQSEFFNKHISYWVQKHDERLSQLKKDVESGKVSSEEALKTSARIQKEILRLINSKTFIQEESIINKEKIFSDEQRQKIAKVSFSDPVETPPEDLIKDENQTPPQKVKFNKPASAKAIEEAHMLGIGASAVGFGAAIASPPASVSSKNSLTNQYLMDALGIALPNRLQSVGSMSGIGAVYSNKAFGVPVTYAATALPGEGEGFTALATTPLYSQGKASLEGGISYDSGKLSPALYGRYIDSSETSFGRGSINSTISAGYLPTGRGESELSAEAKASWRGFERINERKRRRSWMEASADVTTDGLNEVRIQKAWQKDIIAHPELSEDVIGAVKIGGIISKEQHPYGHLTPGANAEVIVTARQGTLYGDARVGITQFTDGMTTPYASVGLEKRAGKNRLGIELAAGNSPRDGRMRLPVLKNIGRVIGGTLGRVLDGIGLNLRMSA